MKPAKPSIPLVQGLARELARMNLTLNIYTQWYWKIDLHNLMHFPAPARQSACTIRNPGLRQSNLRSDEAVGTGYRRRL